MRPLRIFECLIIVSVLGCQGISPKLLRPPRIDMSRLNVFSKFKTRSQSPEDDDDFETKVKTPLIGEYTNIAGLNLITLQGVGLVTGLDGTGGDPPPSTFRTALLDDMRRRNIRNPNRILRSPSTALVVVRAYLPPLVQQGDRFDVEVRLPTGSEATSLAGGWLMETRLTEKALIPGQGIMSGDDYAKTQGPILISTGEGDELSLAGVLRRGRVLGGALALQSRDMSLYLRNDFRSVRNSKRIADRIGQRFHYYNKSGQREPLAVAKTDQKIDLKILPKYKDNFPRYLQVVRNISFRETEVAQRVRMQKLKRQLSDPATAERSALQLEAIGLPSVPVLKSSLSHPLLEVRFHAAIALTYLGEPDGLAILAEAARKEPAFRAFAFAAMAVIDDAESILLLRELMSGESAETRYGAFRALSTLDRNDPFIRGKILNEQFLLHVLDSQGPSMVHLTKRRKAEIVLFGADQKFSTPLYVRAGNDITISSAPGADKITISRYEVGKQDRRKVVSPRIADVISTVAEFGGSYPDIVQMLVQADRQRNLPGRIAIDALPEAGRVYYRPVGQTGKSTKSKTRVGSPKQVPNLFMTGANKPSPTKTKPAKTDDSEDVVDNSGSSDGRDTRKSDTASLVDITESDSDQQEAAGEKWYHFTRYFRQSAVNTQQYEPAADP